jgi:hypothetical protein
VNRVNPTREVFTTAPRIEGRTVVVFVNEPASGFGSWQDMNREVEWTQRLCEQAPAMIELLRRLVKPAASLAETAAVLLDAEALIKRVDGT